MPTDTCTARVTAPLWRHPDRTGAEDRPVLSEDPDMREWAAAVGSGRVPGLVDRVDTTLLPGEQVHVLAGGERHGSGEGWCLVDLPEQPTTTGPYRGWVRSAHLAPGPPSGDLVVTQRFAVAVDAPGGAPLAELGFGSVLPRWGPGRRGWHRVVLAGSPAWVPAAATAPATPPRPLGAGSVPGRVLLETAQLFLDVPYLWGGACAYGVDCSGLVHLVARRYGLRVPRDAHDQASVGMAVHDSDWQPGDLVFFAARPDAPADHVGLAAGGRWLLHAPETGRRVTLQPITPAALQRVIAVRRWSGATSPARPGG